VKPYSFHREALEEFDAAAIGYAKVSPCPRSRDKTLRDPRRQNRRRDALASANNGLTPFASPRSRPATRPQPMIHLLSPSRDPRERAIEPQGVADIDDFYFVVGKS
jgi:hypothetical protein